MTRGQAQRRIGEDIARPGARATRPQLRVVPELAIGRELRADQPAVGVGLRRVVAAAHVGLDVCEAALGEVRLQLGEGIACGHVRHQAHVDLGDGPVRQHRLAPRTCVAADQPFDVDRRLRLEQQQRIDPARVVDPALDAERLLHGALGSLGRALPHHPLLRRGQRLRVLEEPFDRRRVTIRPDQSVQRLHQVPARGIDLRLEARVHIVGRPAAPALSARDQLELHHALGAERHQYAAVAILARLGHEDPGALVQLGQHLRGHDELLEVR